MQCFKPRYNLVDNSNYEDRTSEDGEFSVDYTHYHCQPGHEFYEFRPSTFYLIKLKRSLSHQLFARTLQRKSVKWVSL